MKELIKQKLNEVALTKSDIKDEVSNQLDSNPIKKKIEDIVSAKIKGDKALEDKVVDIVKNVLTQLYKTLYTKKGFWKDNLSNKSN
jgi:methyl coenzyme M reductase subunit C